MKHLLRPSRLSALVGLLTVVTLGLAHSSRAASSVPTASKAGAEGDGRVLVVGFDGADWRKTEELMGAGELPNMKKLMEAGTAGPLVSTNPAESAAGWAAINTGANP
ncbi:MAG: alkaline phosphatase family protein, partial [Planctomycetota bacterium]